MKLTTVLLHWQLDDQTVAIAVDTLAPSTARVSWLTTKTLLCEGAPITLERLVA